MTLEKALEIVKLIIASKTDNNEITITDNLQFQIACTIISKNMKTEQITEILQ
jgi:hypothetical protein